MEHSVEAYLKRQPSQTLEMLLEQYRQREEYRHLLPMIVRILNERAKEENKK